LRGSWAYADRDAKPTVPEAVMRRPKWLWLLVGMLVAGLLILPAAPSHAWRHHGGGAVFVGVGPAFWWGAPYPYWYPPPPYWYPPYPPTQVIVEPPTTYVQRKRSPLLRPLGTTARALKG